MKIRAYQASDKQAVIQLWDKCGLIVPWNDPEKDIERKLKVGADLFLVGTKTGTLIAVAMGGYDGHRGWVNYLAVAPSLQNKGYARHMMQALELRLIEKGCPKINLQIRESNIDVVRFYEAIGYQTDDSISLGKRLIPDQ